MTNNQRFLAEHAALLLIGGAIYAKAAPGLFVFLGVIPPDQDPAKAAPNHNPAFFVDESALVIGTRTMASLAVTFLTSGSER